MDTRLLEENIFVSMSFFKRGFWGLRVLECQGLRVAGTPTAREQSRILGFSNIGALITSFTK